MQLVGLLPGASTEFGAVETVCISRNHPCLGCFFEAGRRIFGGVAKGTRILRPLRKQVFFAITLERLSRKWAADCGQKGGANFVAILSQDRLYLLLWIDP